MWRVLDVIASDVGGPGRDVHGALAFERPTDSIAVSGRQLQLDDIHFAWSTLDGDLSLNFYPQEEKKTFLFLRNGTIHLDLAEPDRKTVTTAVFPADSAARITLKGGTNYAIAVIPNGILIQRLASLLGCPLEKPLTFQSFPDSHGNSLSLLREQIFQLPATPIIALSDLMGSRNQSLINLLVDCFLMLYPNNYTNVLSAVAPKIAPKHVKRALDYIHLNPHRHVEPQVLADLSSVSKRTLQYSFLSVTGATISGYQRALRLRRAYDMVVSVPEVSLKVIAGMWGFESQAAFGQSFKKAFGVAPSDARRGRDTLDINQK